MVNQDQSRVRESLRVVGAIAAKDMLDAIKDAKILTAVVSVLLVIVLYKTMPSWLKEEQAPRLAIYDAGQSDLVAEWENHSEFVLRQMGSQAEMVQFLGSRTQVVLGLVLPADFDQQVATREQIELDGYFDHWVSAKAADEMRASFEAELAKLTGKPVRIRIERDTAYTQPLGGQPLTVALVLVFVLIVLGLMVAPNLMIEEKETRTLDVLLVSPATAGQVVIAKALVALFYCLAGTAVVFVFFAALIVHWDVAILAAISGALFSVALGLLLGTLISQRQQLIIWTSALMIPLMMPVLVAVILPDIQAPAVVETLVGLLPTVAWAKAVRLSASATAPWSEIGPALALVIGYAILILAGVVGVVRRSGR